MNINWEGTDYAVCPSCKQVVDRESLNNHSHICRSEFDRSPPFADL